MTALLEPIDAPAEKVSPSPGHWGRFDVLAGLVCAGVGLWLATLPHLVALWRYGTLEHLSTIDDITYLGTSRAPYYGEPGLRDAWFGRWEGVRSVYPWFRFGPTSWLARWLGVPLILESLLWRVLGGVITGVVLFGLLRLLVAPTRRPVAWALGGTLFCLADPGFMGGHSYGLRLLLDLPRWYTRGGTLVYWEPWWQYRIVTPLLDLPLVLLLVIAALRSGRNRAWVAVGAVCLALCIVTSFHYWTASALALGLYAIGLAAVGLRSGGERRAMLREAGLVALILVAGLTLGSGQILENRRVITDPVFSEFSQRTGVPAQMPWDEPMRWRYLREKDPLFDLLVGGAVVVAFRSRGLGLLWCFTLAAYLLKSHAAFTGLDVENWQWAFTLYPMGEVLILVTVARTADRWAGSLPPALPRLAWGGLGVLLLMAGFGRAYDAARGCEGRVMNEALAALRPLWPLLSRLEADAALAGPGPWANALAALYGRAAVLYFYPYSWNSMVPTAVVHEHHALNGWLQGLSAEHYAELARKSNRRLGLTTTPRPGNPDAPERQGPARMAIFRRLQDDPQFAASLMARYRPRYLLLPASAPTPERGGPWSLAGSSGTWSLWVRETAPEGSSVLAGHR